MKGIMTHTPENKPDKGTRLYRLLYASSVPELTDEERERIEEHIDYLDERVRTAQLSGDTYTRSEGARKIIIRRGSNS